MTNLISIRRRTPGEPVTPQIVAMERFHSGDLQPSATWIPEERLQGMQDDLWKLVEIGQQIDSLPEEVYEAISTKVGFDISGVFDYAFRAHFELSVAEETMRLLRASLASKGIAI